ncbi:MAG: hypothetical protein IKP50_00425 [Bacilli bacterium]|nr:hypothetical protein [Bacilli bacterium]
MIKMTANTYFSKHPEERNYPEHIGAKYFYVSTNENCPCIGVEYVTGDVFVFGARYDRKIEDLDELEFYLNKE